MNPEDNNLPSSTPGDDELAPGSVFAGVFHILARLGSGGMGTVYRAQHEMTERTVALKILHKNLALESDKIKRFQSEARTLSQLDHENIVRIISCGISEQGLPFIVMEELTGETLQTKLEKEHVLEPAYIHKLMQQILSGLAHAHEAGIMHRDLKPSNIMLVDNGTTAKIMDFGIAKLLPTMPSGDITTNSGSILGSPLYMSPEQCSGSHLDERCDLYALGCILYECLTGEPPFSGENNLEVMYKHVNDPVPPFKAKSRKPLTRTLQAIALRCLSKDPQHRYASADKMQEALTEQGSAQHLKLAPIGNSHASIIATVLLLAAVATLALLMQKKQPADPQTTTIHTTRQQLDPMSKTSGLWLQDANRVEAQILKEHYKANTDHKERLQEAIAYADCALVAAMKRPRLSPEVRLKQRSLALQTRAHLHLVGMEYDQALTDINEAIALETKTNHPNPILLLTLQGQRMDIYMSKDEWEKALELGKWLLVEQDRVIGDTPSEMRLSTLSRLSTTCEILHRNKEACQYAEQSWNLRKGLSEPESQEAALNQLFYAYYHAHEFEKAEQTAVLWNQFHRQIGAPGQPNDSIIALGLFDVRRGKIDAGLKLIETEMVKARALEPGIQADYLQSYQNALAVAGHLDESTSVLKEEIALRKTFGSPKICAILNRYNVLLTLLLGRHLNIEAEAAAREMITQAEEIKAKLQKAGDSSYELQHASDMKALGETHLASALTAQKRFQEALPYWNTGINYLQRRTKQLGPDYCSALVSRGQVSAALGNRDQACKDFEFVCANAKGLLRHRPDIESRACGNYSGLLKSMGRSDKAAPYDERAAQLSKRLKLLQQQYDAP